MNRTLIAGALLIFPLTFWGQSSDLSIENGKADEDVSDRVFDYVSQVREQREAKTVPPPAVQRQSRKEILDMLSPLLTTRDTPRGVVVTVPPSEFQAGKLRPNTAEKVAQVAAMVVAHPGVKVVVEGYSESANGEDAQGHAQAVREKLIDTGVDPETARAIGYVKASLTARAASSDNGRVEIVISGPAIGSVALTAVRNDGLTAGRR
jgi:outer membrane protein OmpA-like peptidoglycan-associated protein